MPCTFGEDTSEIGARTGQARVLLVAFDLSLSAMGAAQGLLGRVSLTGAGAQSSPRSWALQVVGHDQTLGCLTRGTACKHSYKIPGTQKVTCYKYEWGKVSIVLVPCRVVSYCMNRGISRTNYNQSQLRRLIRQPLTRIRSGLDLLFCRE